MKWISSEKVVPLYVWPNDTWYNESDGNTYLADIEKRRWISSSKEIPFPPKKCVVFNN